MPPKTETPSEAPRSSPQTPQEIAVQVNNHLEKLKADVAKEADPAEKKKLVKQCFDQMNKEEREELSKRVEGKREGIPRELLDDLIGVLDLADERKAALRAEIEAAEKAKDEGWTGWAGNQLHEGVATVKQWGKDLWGFTEKWGGKGWDSLVAGVVATWELATGALDTVRETFGKLLGPLISKVKLPEGGTFGWVKTLTDFLIGDYGVVYKNFAKFKIEVQPNDPKQSHSLQPFMEKFQVISVTGQNVSFDEYCRLVALKLREDPAKKTVIPLKITQAQLEQAADQVVAQRLSMPAAPAVAPQAAPPATVAGAAPAQAVAPGAVPAAVPAVAGVVAGVPGTSTAPAENLPPAQDIAAIAPNTGADLIGVPFLVGGVRVLVQKVGNESRILLQNRHWYSIHVEEEQETGLWAATKRVVGGAVVVTRENLDVPNRGNVPTVRAGELLQKIERCVRGIYLIGGALTVKKTKLVDLASLQQLAAQLQGADGQAILSSSVRAYTVKGDGDARQVEKAADGSEEQKVLNVFLQPVSST